MPKIIVNDAQQQKDIEKEIEEVINDTISEVLIIIIIICTFGLFLFIHKSRTDKSYIHKYFKPIDSIMYDPTMDN